MPKGVDGADDAQGAGAQEPSGGQGPESAMRGVLFDLDGTLLDTMELISRSFDHAIRTVLGESRSIEYFARRLGRPLGEQLWGYANDDRAVHAALIEAYRTHNHAIEREAIAIFDGIPEMLDALDGHGYLLGIATSKRHQTAVSNLGVFGLAERFGCLIGYDDVKAPKPDPECIVAAAHALGLAPGECFYVGDSPYDIQAGNAAGAATVAVGWGQHPLERILAAGPALVCERIVDLPALLDTYRPLAPRTHGLARGSMDNAADGGVGGLAGDAGGPARGVGGRIGDAGDASELICGADEWAKGAVGKLVCDVGDQTDNARADDANSRARVPTGGAGGLAGGHRA